MYEEVTSRHRRIEASFFHVPANLLSPPERMAHLGVPSGDCEHSPKSEGLSEGKVAHGGRLVTSRWKMTNLEYLGNVLKYIHMYLSR